MIAIALTVNERYNNHVDRAQAHSPYFRRLFPHRFEMWQADGLSARAAADAALDTFKEFARPGRVYFESLPELGEKSLQQLADLAGWPPKRRTAAIRSEQRWRWRLT